MLIRPVARHPWRRGAQAQPRLIMPSCSPLELYCRVGLPEGGPIPASMQGSWGPRPCASRRSLPLSQNGAVSPPAKPCFCPVALRYAEEKKLQQLGKGEGWTTRLFRPEVRVLPSREREEGEPAWAPTCRWSLLALQESTGTLLARLGLALPVRAVPTGY